jgi:hypothetical protein
LKKAKRVGEVGRKVRNKVEEQRRNNPRLCPKEISVPQQDADSTTGYEEVPEQVEKQGQWS